MATRISLSDHLFSKGFGVGGPKGMIQRFVVMANDVYPAQKKIERYHLSAAAGCSDLKKEVSGTPGCANV